jgi:hypothetical protein
MTRTAKLNRDIQYDLSDPSVVWPKGLEVQVVIEAAGFKGAYAAVLIDGAQVGDPGDALTKEER